MKARILVTGSTGTIGSYLTGILKQRGADFVALTRTPDSAKSLKDKGIFAVTGDLKDPGSLRSPMEGADRMFLLSNTSPDQVETQVTATKVAIEQGISHIVKVSGLGSSSGSSINITKWHGEIEDFIRESGIGYTFLHAQSFMQNLIGSADTVKQEGAIYSSMDDGKISMIDTRDIGEVAYKCLTTEGHEGKTYRLTGPEAISYHDVAAALSKELGREIQYKKITPEEEREKMLRDGMPEWLADDLTELNKIFAGGGGNEVTDDVEKVTGKKPNDIEKWVKDYGFMFRKEE